MDRGGNRFRGQSKAGVRVALSPLLPWGNHLRGTSAAPDHCGTSKGCCLSKAALGKRGAGAETCPGIGPQGGGLHVHAWEHKGRPCLGKGEPRLSWSPQSGAA